MSQPTRYRLVRTIASGGMAQVYEAISVGERGFERRVAIKRVLPEHAQDESMRRMFLDEARIASRLHHGNIVQVLDYGVVDGTEFLAMEFVEGLDSRRATRNMLKKRRRLPDALALHIIAEVAHALDYAHGLTDAHDRPLGIVHRDVSPQNVLLSWDGDVKLSDFGIAAAVEKEERTATGVVKGKLAYMPPEQALGAKVDPSADVYALGATLYTLLIGSTPASDPDAMTRRLAGEPISLSPDLSEDVADLVRTCMAPRPEDRPTASAIAFRAGQLAARGLDRDAHGALRDWLAPQRPGKKKAGALDDLVGLCLVVTNLEGERGFTVFREDGRPGAELSGSTTKPEPRPDAGDTTPEAAPAEALTESVVLPSRWRPRSFLIGALAVVGIIAAVTTVVAMGESVDDPVGAETPTIPTEPITSRAENVEALVAATLQNADSPEPEQTTPPEPAEDSTMVELTRRLRPTPAPRRQNTPRAETAMATMAMATPTPPDEPEESATTTSHGWIRVGHPSGAGQEQMFVDGRVSGYTPNLVRVRTGARRVEVRDLESGRTLVSRTVVVRADHSRAAPAVLRR